MGKDARVVPLPRRGLWIRFTMRPSLLYLIALLCLSAWAVPMSLYQDERVIAAAAANAAENALNPQHAVPEDADIVPNHSSLGEAEAKAENAGAKVSEGVDADMSKLDANAANEHYPVTLPDSATGPIAQSETLAGPDKLDPKNE